MECEVVDLNHLAQGRYQWLAIVKEVMKPRKFLSGLKTFALKRDSSSCNDSVT
jgi:hypothetical protein